MGWYWTVVGVSRAQDAADDPSGAVLIPTDGTPVQEAISPYGDVDWYRFDPAPGVTLSFQLEADEPPAMELYENDGVTLLAAWCQPGSYTFPARRATYLLKVKPAWDCVKGDYTLVVRPRDPDDHANGIEQVFPEDQLSDIPADWHVVHPVTIDYPGDRDFFRFTVSGPGAFQAVCGSWPYEIKLYDENGVLLMSGAGGGDGVTWASAEAGVYYLEVWSPEGDLGWTNLVLRPVEAVDLAPVDVQVTPVGEERDDLTLDPGERFHVDVEVRNLSDGDAILPANLGINIFLSTDEVLNGDYPAGWLSHEFGQIDYLWRSSDWSQHTCQIETPGRYRLEWEVTRGASDRDAPVIYVDDIELQDSDGNVYWTEDFEHDGDWGPNGWVTDAGDVPAALDSSAPHGGAYAASASGPALQTVQNAKFSVDVDVTSSDSRLLFYWKGAGLDWPNEARFTIRRILPGGESVVVSGDAGVEVGDNPPPPGVYYVLAVINSDRVAPDLNPANDVMSAGTGNQITVNLTVNPADFPDLEASNVQVQAVRLAVEEEAAVEVTWTVSNVGAGETNTDGAGWEDRVFITDDPTGKCGQKILATFPHAGDLAPGRASYTRTEVVYLPRGCTGTWYIGVETDADRTVQEPFAMRDNNVAVCADPLDIAPKPRPNLVITQVQTDKASYALGETMTITYTIKNIGDAEASQAFVDEFHLSNDNVKDGNYEYWLGRNEPYPDDWSAGGDNDWDWVKVGPFSAGTYTFEWRYQKNDMIDWITQGDVWIDSVSFDGGNTFETFSGTDLPDGWQTDADFSWRVDTGNDADGDGSYSLRAGPLPVGRVTHLWVTRTLEEGAWVWFRARTSTFLSIDRLWFRKRPPTLAPGESVQRVVHVAVPDDVRLIGSRRWLVVTIDSMQQVYEENAGGEDDNEVLGTGDAGAGFGGSIEITPPHHPDLAVHIMDDVASVAPGGWHTLIVKTDGSLWACGDNEYGQLGDGTTTDRHTPVHIMDDVASVAAGYFHTLIVSGEPLPQVFFAQAASTAAEGSGTVAVVVHLKPALQQTVTVEYSVTGGTATGGGVDYTLADGTLTFGPGETSKTVDVAIVDDAVAESGETVEITLANPRNAVLGAPTVHTLTIRDNDGGTLFGVLTGTVTGGPNRVGISGATVTAGGVSTHTRSNGQYVISPLSAGNYSVRVSASGYESETRRVTIQNNKTTRVNVHLEPIPAPAVYPNVVSVSSQYGEAFPVMSGMPVTNTYTARVVWNGTPGTVKFEAPNQTKTARAGGRDAYISVEFDMGAAFNPTLDRRANPLKVIATNGEGLSSPPTTLYPFVFPVPSWALDLPGVNVDRYLDSDGYGFDFSAAFPAQPVEAKTTVPSWVPFIGGTFGLQSTQVSLEGWFRGARYAGGIALAGASGFRAGEMGEVSGRAHGGVEFELADAWKVDGRFVFEVKGKLRGDLGCLEAVPVGAVQAFAQTWVGKKINNTVMLFAEVEPQVDAKIGLGLVPEFNFQRTDIETAVGITGGVEIDIKVATGRAYVGGKPKLYVHFPADPEWFKRAEIDFVTGVRVSTSILFIPDIEAEKVCHVVLYESAERAREAEARIRRSRGAGDLKAVAEDKTLVVTKTLRARSRRVVRGPKEKRGANVFVGATVHGIPALRVAAGMDGAAKRAPEAFIHNTFSECDPAVAVDGGNELLVFVYDDPAKPDLQSTEIQYSLKNGAGDWSAPAAITSDTHLDASPRVAFDAGGNAVAVWSRSRSDDLSDPAAVNADMELAYSVRDAATGEWPHPEFVTDNAYLDFAPQLLRGNDGSLLLVWAANEGNETVGGAEHPTRILARKWVATTKAWGATMTVVDAAHGIGVAEFAAAWSGSAGEVVVVKDLDGDPGDNSDTELYHASFDGTNWSALERLTNDDGAEVPDQRPELIYTSSGDLTLTWLRGPQLLLAPALDVRNAVVVRDRGQSAGLVGYSLARDSGDNLFIVWPDDPGGQADLYYRVYDRRHGVWGKDGRLTDDVGMEKAVKTTFTADDRLLLAYARTEIIRETI